MHSFSESPMGKAIRKRRNDRSWTQKMLADEEERYQRYSAWRDTLTPEEKAAHDLVGKQFTDEMLTYLPLMLGSHLSDNTNRWEEVFQSE